MGVMSFPFPDAAVPIVSVPERQDPVLSAHSR